MATWLTASIHRRGLQARRNGEIEQVDVGRDLAEDGRQFGRQKLEPHAAGLAQFDHDVVAVGGGVLDVADHVGKAQHWPVRFQIVAGFAHSVWLQPRGAWLR